MISRRTALAAALCVPALGLASSACSGQDDRADHRLDALERRHGGRLGVAILDTNTGVRLGHRADERFALCSTFKFLAAAFVLARVDAGDESLARRITYTKADLVAYSPATEPHAGDGMELGRICEAAVTLSDNTAGNLMLRSFGGPAALTAYLRRLGDSVTRLDRTEPELNDVGPGDVRDTTTPAAMLALMQTLLLGPALSEGPRGQLLSWLCASRTGAKRIRAGVPADWRVGDKTGSGPYNVANDVAILWPPGRPPILVAAYYAASTAGNDERDAVLAEIGRIAAAL